MIQNLKNLDTIKIDQIDWSEYLPALADEKRIGPAIRPFDKPSSLRKAIINKVVDELKNIKEISNARFTLRIDNIRVDQKTDFSVEEQKKAVLSGRTLGVRVYGDVYLLDSKGNVIDKRPNMLLANIPYYTPRGTFIIRGNEYTMANQLRLKPGIYHRIRESGEIEAHVNTFYDKGVMHRYVLDPTKGIFYLEIGQAKIPLYSVLKELGVSDETMKKVWGEEIFSRNQAAGNIPIARIYKSIFKQNVDPSDPKSKILLKEFFSNTWLDPTTTIHTLRKPYQTITPETILDSTAKLLRISRAEDTTDDRDNMAYQMIYGPEDVIAERVRRAHVYLRQLLWKITNKGGSLSPLAKGFLSQSLYSAITDTGLGQYGEGINPLSFLDQQTRVTRMGYGGISSIEGIPMEARAFQSSYIGFIDPLRTPESLKAGVDTRLSLFVYKGSDNRFYLPVYSIKENKVVWRSSDDLTKSKLGIWSHEWKENSEYVPGVENNELKMLPRKDIEYILPPFGGLFNHLSALIPFAESTHGYRVSRVGTYLSQTLPLVNREAPLVQTTLPGTKQSLFKILGKIAGSVFAEQDGEVEKVNDKELIVKYTDGTRVRYELHNQFPFNRKCVTGDTWILVMKNNPDQNNKWFLGPISSYVYHPGDKILSYDKKTGKIKWKKILQVYKFPCDRKLFRVYLSSGDCITTTEDHAWIIKKRSGRAQEIDAKQLKPGMSVVRCTQWPGNQHVKDNKKVYIGKLLAYLLSLLSPEQILELRANRITLRRIMNWIKSHNKDYSNEIGQLCAELDYHWKGRYWQKVINNLLKSQEPIWKEQNIPIQILDNLLYSVGFIIGIIENNGTYDKKDNTITIHFSNEAVMYTYLWFCMRAGIRWTKMSKNDTSIQLSMSVLMPWISYFSPSWIYQNNVSCYSKENFCTDDTVVKIEPLNTTNIEYVYDLTVSHYHNFCCSSGVFIHNTFLHQTPLVKPGEKFKKDQPLVISNYTDQQGNLAVGVNAHVAVVAYKGFGIEDAYIVSQSFANKMTSEHAYQLGLEPNADTIVSKKHYVSLFPGRLTVEQLAKYDDDGIIKIGSKVKPGEPVILATYQQPILAKHLNKPRKGSFVDASVTWDYDTEGEVMEVYKSQNFINVVVRTATPLQVGDKISGRHGDKGVVALILPDDQMPRDENGKPFDVIFNPAGIPTRVNPGQLIELALGKVAKARGQPYIIANGSNDDWIRFAINELKNHNLSDKETIYDPVTGIKIPDIVTGYRYFLKLEQTSASKKTARGRAEYTAEETPARGGEEGSKRFSVFDTHAALSHGAVHFLRDTKLIRGQKGDEWWLAFAMGYNPPPPKIPLVYEKFINELKASGIQVVRTNDGIVNIYAMGNKDVQSLIGDRYIKNTETVDWRGNMEPIPGGLFDTTLTGGLNGRLWSGIRLAEPMPNPVMEKPIISLLRINEEQFYNILSGKESYGGLSGPKAIARALSRIDIDREIKQSLYEVKSLKGSERDKAIRRLVYLTGIKRSGIHPSEWMWESLPIIPPIFRPVSILSSGGTLVADANYLYKEVFDANKNLEEMKKYIEHPTDERKTLYDAIKAVVGLGEPTHPKNRQRQVTGFLAKIVGPESKFSYVQTRLLGMNADLTARAVIVPNPDLSMDECGLPESIAWPIYKMFIVRRLVRSGMPLNQALEEYEKQTDRARQALLNEMEERPIVIDRAPILFKYGLMAFWPKLVKGDSLHINPIVLTGFNADFDGDQMNIHVPVTREAIIDAITKMMPSRNLFFTRTFKAELYLPKNEYLGGLHAVTYKATQKPEKVKRFSSVKEALKAYWSGQLRPDEHVDVPSFE